MAELKQVSLNKLFIANRGEIALRIARTAREIGWHTVGVYAADDEMSPWADQFDALVRLEARGVAAYLDGQALIDIARVQGCSHLHPGYGFLSENAGFAQAVGEAGLHFVGPAPETLARLGDKASARALAQQAGVPVIPGSEILDDAEAALGFFNDQAGGLPIMLKAVAGGGGRGMRRVDEATELAEAFARCASEAHSAFGDGRLYAEAVIQGARHIEVQLIGDGQGSVSHLWERECSLQRRHQKLVEIAPAPGLDPALRQQALEHALAIGSAAGLASLATVEFLLGADGQLYFLEVNPRLQVEHTVTEEVTGLDIRRHPTRPGGGQKPFRSRPQRNAAGAAGLCGTVPPQCGSATGRRRHPASKRHAARHGAPARPRHKAGKRTAARRSRPACL